jgi:hypothetical protein
LSSVTSHASQDQVGVLITGTTTTTTIHGPVHHYWLSCHRIIATLFPPT